MPTFTYSRPRSAQAALKHPLGTKAQSAILLFLFLASTDYISAAVGPESAPISSAADVGTNWPYSVLRAPSINIPTNLRHRPGGVPDRAIAHQTNNIWPTPSSSSYSQYLHSAE